MRLALEPHLEIWCAQPRSLLCSVSDAVNERQGGRAYLQLGTRQDHLPHLSRGQSNGVMPFFCSYSSGAWEITLFGRPRDNR